MEPESTVRGDHHLTPFPTTVEVHEAQTGEAGEKEETEEVKGLLELQFPSLKTPDETESHDQLDQGVES